MSSRILFVAAPRLPDDQPPTGGSAPSSAKPSAPPPPSPAGLRGSSAPAASGAPTAAQRGQSGPLDARVDGAALALALERALAEAASAGWEVRQIVPIQSGAYAFGTQLERHFEGWSSAGAGYGFGFSYTSGLLVHLEHRAPTAPR